MAQAQRLIAHLDCHRIVMALGHFVGTKGPDPNSLLIDKAVRDTLYQVGRAEVNIPLLTGTEFQKEVRANVRSTGCVFTGAGDHAHGLALEGDDLWCEPLAHHTGGIAHAALGQGDWGQAQQSNHRQRDCIDAFLFHFVSP